MCVIYITVFRQKSVLTTVSKEIFIFFKYTLDKEEPREKEFIFF